MRRLFGLWEKIARGWPKLRVAARQYGVNPVVLGARVVWAEFAHGISLAQALNTGALDPRIPGGRGKIIVSGVRYFKRLWPYNPGADSLVDDKAVFYARCRAYGLPIPKLHGVVIPPLGLRADGRLIRGADEWRKFFLEEAGPELVIKPAESASGEGVGVFTRKDGAFHSGGKIWSADDMYRRLAVEGELGRAVIQERLRNHSGLLVLSPAPGLQTMRVITLVRRDGEVEIMYAFLKVIVGDALIDNFCGGATGNLVAYIDPKTGRLGATFGPGPERIGMTRLEKHPASGKPFADWTVPLWDDVVALAKRAALQFLPKRALGWDIALTPEGPVLVEGNTNWGPYNELGFWYSPEEFERLRELF